MNLINILTKNKPRLIMFDLDGTLVDSVPDLSYAIDAMLEELDMPKAGQEHIRHWVGNGAAMLVKRALTGKMIPHEIAESLFHKANALFLRHYQLVNGQKSTLYPGVLATLKTLRESVSFLALITNKPEQFTQALLDYHHLPKFDVLVCGDTLAKKKPDPDPILHCLDVLKCDANESIMVGDSVSDIKAAKAANVPIICVNYGYNQGENLSDYYPEFLIHSFDELVS